MLSIAVDIGGTFTDVVALDDDAGALFVVKTPSTPQRPVEGVRAGALEILRQSRRSPADVSRFVHGTTVGTNAVLERKGARIAVLATSGFEDVLEIGRLRRTAMYDLSMESETPTFLARRRYRYGIVERIGAHGEILVPLDEDQVRETVKAAIDQGVEAFAVCLLFSFRNPKHEVRVRELIDAIAPGTPVSLSAIVDPMYREYERTVVTAFDAYLRPVIENYVSDLARDLAAVEITAPLQIMQSRGGVTAARMVEERPVSILLSGPAAGVIGARFVAAQCGVTDVITLDVGGTSADISLVADGKPIISTEGRIDTYPLRVPMVDVNTIGAGGGSVAWVDPAGGFRVGPRSAGSEPGPACYGRGGTEPTVTDASIVLGFLNPEYFAGGAFTLDVELAHQAISRLATRLNLSPVETAAGIHRVINTKMGDEIRLVSVRRGYDPRDFALVALGGAGPVHAGRLARDLSIPTVLVPPAPGVLSALGLLAANEEHDYGETVSFASDSVNSGDLQQVYKRLAHTLEGRIRSSGASRGRASFLYSADLRYVGQSYTLEVPIADPQAPDSVGEAVRVFHETHRRVHGHARPNAPTEFVNLRLVSSRPLTEGPALATASTVTIARIDIPQSRRVWFDELGDYTETPVYSRAALARGEALRGPAIVEQPDTTVVIYPDQIASVDQTGTLVLVGLDSQRHTATTQTTAAPA